MTRHTWLSLDQVRFGMDHSLRHDVDGRWGFEVSLTPIIGLTKRGVQVQVWYDARGDYIDRWVDRRGTSVEIVQWRPVQVAQSSVPTKLSRG